LIDWIIKYEKENKVFPNGQECMFQAESLEEKEKELIINTFIEGEVNCGRQLAQDYYNEKFNNNEN
jgi:hypothetical protein